MQQTIDFMNTLDIGTLYNIHRYQYNINIV